jgi:hypothetical protein
MKIAAFIVFVISAWLTYGANSLYQKDPGRFGDPAHLGKAPVLILFAITVASAAVMFLAKSGKSKSGN